MRDPLKGKVCNPIIVRLFGTFGLLPMERTQIVSFLFEKIIFWSPTNDNETCGTNVAPIVKDFCTISPLLLAL